MERGFCFAFRGISISKNPSCYYFALITYGTFVDIMYHCSFELDISLFVIWNKIMRRWNGNSFSYFNLFEAEFFGRDVLFFSNLPTCI